jgi:lipopolysaccharide export system permease protein
VELNKRLVLALSSFAFVWLGIPLGTRAHRKESSIGIGISLLLVTVFYLFVITGESLAKYPGAFPYVIVWIPVLTSLGLGAYLIGKSN